MLCVQENLKALKAQEEKREAERKEEEQRQKDIIQATGQNVTVEMVRRQRQRDIERQKMYDIICIQCLIA